MHFHSSGEMVKVCGVGLFFCFRGIFDIWDHICTSYKLVILWPPVQMWQILSSSRGVWSVMLQIILCPVWLYERQHSDFSQGLRNIETIMVDEFKLSTFLHCCFIIWSVCQTIWSRARYITTTTGQNERTFPDTKRQTFPFQTSLNRHEIY